VRELKEGEGEGEEERKKGGSNFSITVFLDSFKVSGKVVKNLGAFTWDIHSHKRLENFGSFVLFFLLLFEN